MRRRSFLRRLLLAAAGGALAASIPACTTAPAAITGSYELVSLDGVPVPVGQFHGATLELNTDATLVFWYSNGQIALPVVMRGTYEREKAGEFVKVSLGPLTYENWPTTALLRIDGDHLILNQAPAGLWVFRRR